MEWLEAEFASDKRLLRAAAPELVAAAEAKLRGEVVDPAVYARAAAALTDQQGGAEIDTVVLACTHFPLVEAELAKAQSGGLDDSLTHLYQERCEELISHPPESWDGVWTMTKK